MRETKRFAEKVQHDLGIKPLDDARRMRERERNIILYITQIVSSL